MITVLRFEDIALALPHSVKKPHFERTSFRIDVPKGKIFATLKADEALANVFLTPEEQTMLVSAEPEIFFKVPNKWGDKGATTLRLNEIDEMTLRSVLIMSWRHATPEKYHADLSSDDT